MNVSVKFHCHRILVPLFLLWSLAANHHKNKKSSSSSSSVYMQLWRCLSTIKTEEEVVLLGWSLIWSNQPHYRSPDLLIPSLTSGCNDVDSCYSLKENEKTNTEELSLCSRSSGWVTDKKRVSTVGLYIYALRGVSPIRRSRMFELWEVRRGRLTRLMFRLRSTFQILKQTTSTDSLLCWSQR